MCKFENIMATLSTVFAVHFSSVVNSYLCTPDFERDHESDFHLSNILGACARKLKFIGRIYMGEKLF